MKKMTLILLVLVMVLSMTAVVSADNTSNIVQIRRTVVDSKITYEDVVYDVTEKLMDNGQIGRFVHAEEVETITFNWKVEKFVYDAGGIKKIGYETWNETTKTYSPAYVYEWFLPADYEIPAGKATSYTRLK